VHFHQAQLRRESLSPRDRALLDMIEPVVARDPADWVEAARRGARATERFPRDAQLWAIRSYLDHAESYEAAHADADRALALDPSYGEALAEDAEALLYLGRVDEARRRLDACFELLGAAYTSCSYIQTEVDAELGNCAQMEARARRAIGSGALPAYAHERLARALAARGAAAEAVRETLGAEARAVPASRRRERELSGQVRLSLLGGEFVAAERDARAMLDFFASDPRASKHGVPTEWLAEALVETGRVEEAGQAARAFLDRRDGWDPDPLADEYAMSQDVTAPLLAIARDAKLIPPAEAASRRDAWLHTWTSRTRPTYRPSLWMYAYPPLVDTEATARAALETPHDALPPYRPNTLADADVGHAFLLAGRTDEAITLLGEATRSCRALEYPVLHTRAHDWLGQACEVKGDRAGACAAYAVVVSRWGHAVPRSVTADHARARMAALGCDKR
jgi:serine/threonine-protein kinase